MYEVPALRCLRSGVGCRMMDAPLEVEGRRINRVVRWIEPGYCVVRDEAGLPLTCYRSDEGFAGAEWRFTKTSREFIDSIADASPIEILIASIVKLFEEANSLRRINRAAKEHYAECARDGRNPGSPWYPSPSLASEVEQEAEAALARYLREWTPGQPILHGFIECAGDRPDGGSGPHLRRALRPDEIFDIHPDHVMADTVRQQWVPEIGLDETTINTFGSPVPIIASRRARRFRRDYA